MSQSRVLLLSAVIKTLVLKGHLFASTSASSRLSPWSRSKQKVCHTRSYFHLLKQEQLQAEFPMIQMYLKEKNKNPPPLTTKGMFF